MRRLRRPSSRRRAAISRARAARSSTSPAGRSDVRSDVATRRVSRVIACAIRRGLVGAIRRRARPRDQTWECDRAAPATRGDRPRPAPPGRRRPPPGHPRPSATARRSRRPRPPRVRCAGRSGRAVRRWRLRPWWPPATPALRTLQTPSDVTAPTGPDPRVAPTAEASRGRATSAPRAARTGPVNWAPVRASSPDHTMAAVDMPVSATSAM